MFIAIGMEQVLSANVASQLLDDVLQAKENHTIPDSIDSVAIVHLII